MFPTKRQVPIAHDSPLRWLVPSSSKPGEHHLVQLDGFGTNGKCSCPDFTCRHEPLLRQDPRLGGVDKTRCKHIRLVRAHFLDRLIRELASQAKALLLLACAGLGAAPTPHFLDALAWAETQNQDVTGDRGEAAGRFQFHRSAWLEADWLRQQQNLVRQDYDQGARCPAMSRAYAATLLGEYERRLRARGIQPTASRLWLCWSMGWTGASRIGFNLDRAPSYKRRGYHRLSQRLGTFSATDR